MEDIQKLLDEHRSLVAGLLRKHKISGEVNAETIKRAYDAKGEHFMMDLLAIITPNGSTSNYTPDLTSLMPMKSGQPVSTLQPGILTPAPAKGKAWTFLDNLFNTATKAGEAIGSVQKNTADPNTAQMLIIQQAETDKTNMLYLIAAGFIALILIILIFKK
jgi:hypothetical protein